MKNFWLERRRQKEISRIRTVVDMVLDKKKRLLQKIRSILKAKGT